MRNPLDGRIESVLDDSEVYARILQRKSEFSRKIHAPLDEKFSELTFCTLTANTSAEMGMRCEARILAEQKYDVESLRKTLVACRYRFPNTRSRFISMNYKKMDLLDDILQKDERRELLVENYIGIGMKEASHFLRNIGYFQYPILDKHIQRFLSSYFGKEVKIKNKRDYEKEEKLFLEISGEYGLEPGIMDLVIWYIMTGKVLK